jgi:uncharacterized protein (DUF488 family)
VEIYTIGFTQKTAGEFFGQLRTAGIRRVIDVRLNNTSQLARFTKREDLPFFLRELCGAEYLHEPLLAPTQDILDAFKKDKGAWEEYERQFLDLLQERRVEEEIPSCLFQTSTALLCSELKPDNCHRRLAAEYLSEKWGGIKIIHL